ncbi:hypothetical protein HYR99_22460 [Candidatus Poribacteria bacterium]|nr:hypothetical protein [Candidatus Poribacteria bacterium]
MRTLRLLIFIVPITLAGCLSVNITKELRLNPDGSGILAIDVSADLEAWSELLSKVEPAFQRADRKQLMKLTEAYLDGQVPGDLHKLPSYVRWRAYTTHDSYRHWIVELDFKNHDDADRRLRMVLQAALRKSQAVPPDEQEMWQEVLEPDPFFTRWQLQHKDNLVSLTIPEDALTLGEMYRVVLPGQLVFATVGQVQRTPQGDVIIWEGDVFAPDVRAVWDVSLKACTVQWRGKPYYVDVVTVGQKASVWLRVKPNASSAEDIKILKLEARNMPFDDAMKLVCRAKEVYDSGRTIIGCAATVGSGACIAGAVPSGGATVAVCSASLTYTFDRGLQDCVVGVSDFIAARLIKSSEWPIVAEKAAVDTGQFGDAISRMIDTICADIDRK